MVYDSKVVFCGNVVEIYEYKESIIEGYANKIEKKKREQTLDIKLENFNRSMKRTKEKIRHLVNTNYIKNKSSFLTLTFKENLQDYDVAFDYWKRFKQKIEYHYKIKLQYVGVVEFQERGAIHFHICLFNVPFMEHDKLYNMWSDLVPGGVYIERIKDNQCDNVGAYITKYMTKDNVDFFDNEFKGKKRYFKSRGLKEPYVMKYSTNELPQDKRDFQLFLNGVKDNIVFEYQSKEFEIRKKDVVYVDNDEDIKNESQFIRIKKELQENKVSTQQLTYKQVILEQNVNRKFGKLPTNY